MYVIKRNESEEQIMFDNVCELAVYKWGLEDVRTVAVCTIFEKMGETQAPALYCYLCDS